MPKKKQPRRPKILVSSVVYGYEDFLHSIYTILESYGYEVLMSFKGTIPIDPDVSAMDSCLQAVDECDLFLGLVLPEYGSGIEKLGGLSITHREAIRAIELNKPRWFLVHEHVSVARGLYRAFRDDSKKPEYHFKKGIKFKKSPYLSNLRVLEMFELAMGHHVPEVKDRTGNWVQPFKEEDDARLFVSAQFRHYRDVQEIHLPKLKGSVDQKGGENG